MSIAAGSLTSISLSPEFAARKRELGSDDRNRCRWHRMGTRRDARRGARRRPAAVLIPLGELTENAGAEGSRPAEIRTVHPPRVIAVDNAGHVAMGLEATSIVRIYNSVTRAFTDLRLPKGTDAFARYFKDGRLAIGLANDSNGGTNTAVIAALDGSLSKPINVGDASLFNAFSDTVVLAGVSIPTILNSDGTTARVTLPPGLQPAPNLAAFRPLRMERLSSRRKPASRRWPASPARTSPVRFRIRRAPPGPRTLWLAATLPCGA